MNTNRRRCTSIRCRSFHGRTAFAEWRSIFASGRGNLSSSLDNSFILRVGRKRRGAHYSPHCRRLAFDCRHSTPPVGRLARCANRAIVEPQAADALHHAQTQRLQQTFNRFANGGGLSVFIEEVFRRTAQPLCHSTADGRVEAAAVRLSSNERASPARSMAKPTARQWFARCGWRAVKPWNT